MDIISGIGNAVGGAVGGVVGGALKMVTSQVDGILGQFSQGQNELEDLVHKPMQTMLQDLESSDMWAGPGAEAFKQELKSTFVPNATSIGNMLNDLTKWLTDSRNEVQKADDEAVNEIKSLEDFFKSI